MELLTILKQKNKVLNIALIIFAVIFAKNIYKKQISDLEHLKQRRAEETERNKAMEGIAILEKRVNVYKANFPKKDTNVAINDINSLAKEMNVEILSIKPEAEQRYRDYLAKTPFILNITVTSFHNLAKFISRIESARDYYIVENIDISGDPEAGLSATLKISSLVFVQPGQKK